MAKKTAQLIDGKKIANAIYQELKIKSAALKRRPGLAVILVGDDPASHLYVKNKKIAAEKIGIDFHLYRGGSKDFYPKLTQTELLEMIGWLNNDQSIDAIIVQLPLPKKYETKKVLEKINSGKDVDAFLSQPHGIVQPLIAAIHVALLATKTKVRGLNATIVSKNPIFSEPLAANLRADGLKVTAVAPDDPTLKEKTKSADILVSVVGRQNLITPEMVKPDAIVLDAGTVIRPDGTWVGDADPTVKKIAGWLTPVPGGLGPLTVAMLLKNTIELASHNQ